MEIRDGQGMHRETILLFMQNIQIKERCKVLKYLNIAFIVDTNSKGIKKMKIENKLGLRSLQNYQIYFENVKVPSESFIPDAKSFRKGV